MAKPIVPDRVYLFFPPCGLLMRPRIRIIWTLSPQSGRFAGLFVRRQCHSANPVGGSRMASSAICKRKRTSSYSSAATCSLTSMTASANRETASSALKGLESPSASASRTLFFWTARPRQTLSATAPAHSNSDASLYLPQSDENRLNEVNHSRKQITWSHSFG